jgi:protein-S-isoprenylcysteine O-methyltransferase Ste14
MLDVVYFLIGLLVLLFIITFILLSKDLFKTGIIKVHKIKVRKKESFWVSAIFLVLCVSVIIGEFIKMRPATEWYNYIGAALIFFGGLIRIYSRKALDRFFSFEVIIQKDHKLITKGIYKNIRHPMYLGISLILLGLATALSSIYGILFLIILGVPVLLYRISAEEDMLIKEFGQEYLKYMERTKKLIPYIY